MTLRATLVWVCVLSGLFGLQTACDIFEDGGHSGGGKTVIQGADTGCGTVWVECEYTFYPDPTPFVCNEESGVDRLACVDDSLAQAWANVAECGRADDCNDWKANLYECYADHYAARATCAAGAEDETAYNECADAAVPTLEDCDAQDA